MSKGNRLWSEPLTHLQMLITTSGGKLRIRVLHTVFLNKHSSGTYHVLSTGLDSLQISTHWSLITTPWITDYYYLLGRDGNLEVQRGSPGNMWQSWDSNPGSQAPRSVMLTNHLMCCSVDMDWYTHLSHSLCWHVLK